MVRQEPARDQRGEREGRNARSRGAHRRRHREGEGEKTAESAVHPLERPARVTARPRRWTGGPRVPAETEELEVVEPTPVRIAENFIGGADRLEPLPGLGIAGVSVGMVLLGEPAVGPPDVELSRIPSQAQ